MELQYVSDSEGKPTAVLIPIAEWNSITAKHKDLKDLTPKSIVKKTEGAARFRGILTSEEVKEYQEYAKQARAEWDRDI
ncbi:MAG: hypothetical protein M3O71_19975 [Bacteroidota bacterium]|nr:hypothetical protein [Bacteroidota bacterium]